MQSFGNTELILFYSSTPRTFRTTLIGYLYEIAQVYRVVLLSEELDFDVLTIIQDKNYFPNLDKIIPLYQHTGPTKNLLSKNKYLCQMAKTTIRDYKPDIVIASSDWHSLFEMYLMRFAKRINALRITFQDTVTFETEKSGIWIDLINSYCKMPDYFPLWFKYYFIKLRKYMGHIIFYWILPILNFEKPFFGKSSYILHKGHSGSRDSDYHMVMTERDYNIYSKSGINPDKLYILKHPITRKSKEIFTKIISLQNKLRFNINCMVATVMLPAEEIGFSRTNYSLIKKEDRIKAQNETFKILLQILKEWKIVVKPHPSTKNYYENKQRIENISKSIIVVDPQEPSDKYIDLADIIIEMPRAASTTLYSASLQCPQKPIIALDLHDELLGDYYKNFDGVEYINNIKDFISILKKIKKNNYLKKSFAKKENEIKNFSSSIDALKYFLEKKHIDVFKNS